MREMVILLALGLAMYHWQRKQRPQRVNTDIPWANLILGLALFIAITMASHAAPVSANVLVYALLTVPVSAPYRNDDCARVHQSARPPIVFADLKWVGECFSPLVIRRRMARTSGSE